MKKVFRNKLLSFTLALAIVFTLPASVFASAEISPWAEFDVSMAQTLYNLGDSGTYSNYGSVLTAAKFVPVYKTLAEANGLNFTFDSGSQAMTRGDVVNALYEIISGSETVDAGAALDYFVAEKLLMGRAGNNYMLDENCTVEEMIVFALRAYEHLMYKAGEDTKGFFWEVQGNGNKVYLLGSVHFADAAMYPLSKAIVNGFNDAENLVVEVDVASQNDELVAYTIIKGTYQNGETIQDYVTEETYKMYVEFSELIGLTEYDTYKPWFANNMVTAFAAATLDSGGAQTAEEIIPGMDMYLLYKALYAGKPILELETADSQIDMFDSFSPELQETLLNASLNAYFSAGEGDEEDSNLLQEAVQELIDVIKGGDDVEFSVYLNSLSESDEPEMEEYNYKLFTERDSLMAEKIIGYLKGGGDDYFVVVGAGHMLGETGIVNVLKGKGYDVVRLK